MNHILQSKIFSDFPEIHQGTSSKFFWPLSFTYSKDTNQVIIDRVRFLDALSLDASHSVLVCEQNHTNNVIVIRDEHVVHGLFEQSNQLPNADGMITNIPNVNLIVYTADCMPISFYDPVHQTIGVAHSGWRGTISDISKNIIENMEKEYGTNPEDIRVTIWPSIWPCCYEVENPEQIRAFEEKYGNIIHRDGKVFIDLWDSIEQDMKEIGILPENFENRKICTCCHHDIYASHRADNPNTTANLTAICIKE